MKTHRYTVRGSGAFPLDMLRYDASFPAFQEDVFRITDRGDRTITLFHIGDRAWYPTKARWESFGWAMIECRRDS